MHSTYLEGNNSGRGISDLWDITKGSIPEKGSIPLLNNMHHTQIKKKYARLSQTTTLEFDTEQSVNVSPLQSHRVFISGAGVRASRWHQMTCRPAATLPCQNISWLAFPAFLALLSKTLRNTQHLTLHPHFFFFFSPPPANGRPFTTFVPDEPRRPSLTPLKCHFHTLLSCRLAALCMLQFYFYFVFSDFCMEDYMEDYTRGVCT